MFFNWVPIDFKQSAIPLRTTLMVQNRKPDRSPRAAESGTQAGGDLFIVDNSEKDWKVRRYLHDWAEISTSFDIATGCFEIGSLLALDGQWQKLDKIRILMGSETTRRTRQALLEALKNAVATQLDSSIEKEKDKKRFFERCSGDSGGAPQASIECKVYTIKVQSLHH